MEQSTKKKIDWLKKFLYVVIFIGIGLFLSWYFDEVAYKDEKCSQALESCQYYNDSCRK